VADRDGVLDLRFEHDDLGRAAVRALLEEHLTDMYATSPPESVHALDLDALREPGVEFWSAWAGEELRGCGALKALGERDVELKSMRTAATSRRSGVGAAVLTYLLGRARDKGFRRVLLETVAQDYFGAARRLYERHGFVVRPPFADYTADPNSVFYELAL
jgi:putative acetyltransferase